MSDVENKPVAQQSIEGLKFARLCHAVLNSKEGKELFSMLRQEHIESSYFVLPDYSAWGGITNYMFFRMGHANLIRLIEQHANQHDRSAGL